MLLSGKKREAIAFVLNICALCFCANSFLLLARQTQWILPAILLLVAANLLPMYSKARFPSRRIHLCNHAVKCLVLFGICTLVSIAVQLFLAFVLLPDRWGTWLASVLQCTLVLATVFWNGIVCVYLTSWRLGVRPRILGAILGLVPIANLIMLRSIIKTASAECDDEVRRHYRELERADQRLCATQYPIVLVHGVFFRDTVFFNYWGRIPAALQANGARIFYGEHQSAASVADSARELAERIEAIVQKTGSEKVNIIAHSKGGLDCRYLLAHTAARERVASLTTINTPHRGCEFADYLLGVIPKDVQQNVAEAYNKTMRKLGDASPDLLAAVGNLTSEYCTAFDAATPLPEGIVCKSYGSVLKKASDGKFPLNFTYMLAKYFDGPNDGLVGQDSFQFCPDHTLLTTPAGPGISHGDMIDLNRTDVPGFDVREFYVQLVADLKNKGL